jgi:hypothetical protein
MGTQSGHPRPPPSNDLMQLGRLYLECGSYIWIRALTIGLQNIRPALTHAVKIGFEAERPERIQGAILPDLRNYWMELATLLPTAVDGLSRGLDESSVANPFGFMDPSYADLLPKTYLVQDVPVMMPVRIADASQGWALYFVSGKQAQTHLSKQRQPFEVVVLGGGRTPVAILGMDYRGTDLGTYQELGVAFFVRPQHAPREMPGMLFLSLTVSDEYNVERAKVLWGYDKTFSRAFAATHHAGFARFAIDRDDETALAVSFPKFGRGRSSNMPCYTYGTIRDPAGNEIPHKTLISRSASGEGMQVGGRVELRLGDGTQSRCVCQLGNGNGRTCVCLMLRDLGLPRPAAAIGWAEHMHAVVGTSTPAVHGPCETRERMSDGAEFERIDSGVVTEAMVAAAGEAGKRLILGKGVIITPLAQDKINALHLDIEREN